MRLTSSSSIFGVFIIFDWFKDVGDLTNVRRISFGEFSSLINESSTLKKVSKFKIRLTFKTY